MDFTERNFSEDSLKITESSIHNSLKLTAIHLVGGICCYICRLTFRDKKSYDEHYKQHKDKEIIYTCVVCEREYNDYPRFRCHCYAKHVINEKFKCDKCSKYFTKQAYLKEHQMLHVLNKYKCIPSCGFECATRAEFVLHKQTNNHLPPYPCQKCNVKLYDINICKMHIGQHAETEYICPVCSKHISDKSHLFKHYASSFNILCIYCRMIFISKKNFIEHSKSQHIKIVFACCMCEKQYGKYEEFAEHQCVCDRQLSKKQGTYNSKLCCVCNVHMNDIATCVEHMEMHIVKTYKCTVCSKNCNPEYLARHVRQHFPLDYHICEICEKAFNSSKNLRLHLKCHEERQIFNHMCTLCNKKYKEHKNCLKHLRKVHNVKTHIVNKREEEFIKMFPVDESVMEKQLMKKENDTNTETTNTITEIKYVEQRSDKRHKCNECGRFFNRPSKLKEHMNVHEGRQQYQCRICNKSFSFYRTYYKHLKVIHNTHPKILNSTDSTNRKLAKKKRKRFSYNEEEENSICKPSNSSSAKTASEYIDIKCDNERTCNVIEATPCNVILNDHIVDDEQTPHILDDTHDIVKVEHLLPIIDYENELDMNDNLHEPYARQESKDLQPLENCSQNFHNSITPTETQNVPNGIISSESVSYADPSRDIIYTGMNTIEIDGRVISMDEEMPHIDPFLTIKPKIEVTFKEQSITNAQIASNTYNELVVASTLHSLITKCHHVDCDDASQLKADILSIIQYMMVTYFITQFFGYGEHRKRKTHQPFDCHPLPWLIDKVLIVGFFHVI